VRYSAQLEWRLAAQWAGYRFYGEFDQLDGEQQSDIVAAYRAFHQISAVLDYEAEREMKRKTKKR
jgi:elongation factor P hydroxylase